MIKRTLRIRLVLCLFVCLFITLYQLSFFHLGISYGSNPGVSGETYSQSGRQIDLYTQKEPYSGRGPNQPSDAFAPQAEVILYAHVTYNGDPVMGKIVAFEIHGPINSVENISFTRTAITDDGGVANVSLRMMHPNGHVEEVIFGSWTVVALVEIAEVEVMDTLSFEVGWIIELLRVETLDVNHVLKASFVKGEYMDFKLTVKNIAMTDKVATLIVDVYDELEFHFGQVMLKDELISPGVIVYFLDDVLIPESAVLGVGLAVAKAYTALPSENGVPWCPQASTTFSIVKLIIHDVAVVSVVPFPTEVSLYQPVDITVVVRNEGEDYESFNVSAYYDSSLIGTMPVKSLAPQMETTLTFAWSTSLVPPGDYTISAVASTVPGETDIEDNTFVDGIVRVREYLPPYVTVFPRWLLPLLLILIVLVVANLVITIVLLTCCVIKKKKEKETPVRLPQTRHILKDHRVCSECGREFSALRTFCPYCFAYQGEGSGST